MFKMRSRSPKKIDLSELQLCGLFFVLLCFSENSHFLRKDDKTEEGEVNICDLFSHFSAQMRKTRIMLPL